MNPTAQIKLPNNQVLDLKDKNAGYSVEILNGYLNLKNSEGTVISTVQLPSISGMTVLPSPLTGKNGTNLNSKLSLTARPYVIYLLNADEQLVGVIYFFNEFYTKRAYTFNLANAVTIPAGESRSISLINEVNDTSSNFNYDIKEAPKLDLNSIHFTQSYEDADMVWNNLSQDYDWVENMGTAGVGNRGVTALIALKAPWVGDNDIIINNSSSAITLDSDAVIERHHIGFKYRIYYGIDYYLDPNNNRLYVKDYRDGTHRLTIKNATSGYIYTYDTDGNVARTFNITFTNDEYIIPVKNNDNTEAAFIKIVATNGTNSLEEYINLGNKMVDLT